MWNLNCLVYAGAVTVTKHARRFPRPSSRDRECKRIAEIGSLRRIIGWIRSDQAKRRRGSPLTSNQRLIRTRLIKLCGSSSNRRLTTSLQTKKCNLLRVKVIQLKSLKAQRRKKALNVRYRRDRVKVLRRGGWSGRDGPTPFREEISEYWGGILCVGLCPCEL